MISDCYKELMADPSLLQPFTKDKWMSIHGLPYLHTLHFHIVSERLFTRLASLVLGEKVGIDFINKASRRAMSVEITPLAILVTDSIGKGKMGMITNFCRTDQEKVEPLDTFLALVQRDVPEPCVVMVRVFTNSPYFPWGSFGSPYLDMTTLPQGTLTTHFPLVLLCLGKFLPYSQTQVVLPWEMSWRFTSSSLRCYRKAQRRNIVCLILCHCWSPSSPILIKMWVCKLKKCSTSALPWGSYKKLLRPRPNLNWSWTSNWWDWPWILRTDDSAAGRQMV